MGIALITQMGEQADYLRFMPERTAGQPPRAGGSACCVGGPGWVVLGVLKMLGGALLAYLAISHMVPADRAVDPNQMYLAAYEYVFPYTGWAIAATALFVVVSQLKINVTNAYAGSLAWSNFFARLTHSHPGRVVWVVFNTLIALNADGARRVPAPSVACWGCSPTSRSRGSWRWWPTSWSTSRSACRPKGIEFKRAHLYDVNPVGVGAMGAASVLSVAAHLGFFGPLAQAFSALIATRSPPSSPRRSSPGPRAAATTSPRAPQPRGGPVHRAAASAWCASASTRSTTSRTAPRTCGQICSLCCSLDARCNDLCKPDGPPVGAVDRACCTPCCRAARGRSSRRASATTCC